MHVSLLSWTPTPEVLAAAAARLCYRDVSAVDLLDALTPAEVDHLLEVIIASGHHSVVEHVSFTFAIDGVSRVLTHQLVRHRVGVSYSQQSQRYATVRNAKCVLPDSIAASALAPQAAASFDAAMELYASMLDQGIPKEDARYVLPQAIETRLVMSLNFRALMQIYRMDACLRSQWEMRNLVNHMKHEVHRVSPRLAGELKIKCFERGYCDEANMCTELSGRMPRREELITVGRHSKEYYRELAARVEHGSQDEGDR